ncbi:MAG: glycerophosphoryl diester phosphodiesterase [Hyphomicrobiaceae bacterium]|jgi:glycerophosphoryl diester phosphodiesterase
MPVLAIGHRGAAGHAPENTLSSFLEAVALGADGVELDVQLSADGAVMVFHDDHLDRVTNAKGLLAEQSLDVLSRVDAGSWFHPRFRDQHVPTLGEVLSVLAGSGVVNVELKYGPEMPALVEATLAVVSACDAMESVVFSSFDHRALNYLRQCAPSARIGVLLTYGREEKSLAVAERLGAVNIHPPTISVSREFVELAHRAGCDVWVWTANERKEIRRLIAAGVDGIISDYPERVIQER